MTEELIGAIWEQYQKGRKLKTLIKQAREIKRMNTIIRNYELLFKNW